MLKKIAIGLVALVLLSAFLIARDWDSPDLGRALLGKVGAATGAQISAGGFRLNLLKGLLLDDVSGSLPAEGGTVTFTVEQLVFEHRLLPLFSGTVAIERVLVTAPRFEFTAARPTAESTARSTGSAAGNTGGGAARAPAGPPTGQPAAGSGSNLALDVTLVRIEQATLVARRHTGETDATIDGLDFEMTDLHLDPSRPGLAGLSARGTLAVATLRNGDLMLSDLAGAFALADSRFDVPDMRFRTPSSSVTAKTVVDFGSMPFTYALDATSEHDVNLMLGQPGGFGPAQGRFNAKGAGSDPRDLAAAGEIQLAPGKLPESPAFVGIDKAIGKPVLAGVPYEATSLQFALQAGRLTIDPFRLTTPAARLDLGGTIQLDGPLDVDVALATPREGLEIDGVGATVLDVLADDQGWVPVPIAVTGTMNDPRVRPDVGALASMAKAGTAREVKSKATDALRGLIKRKHP